MDLNKDVILGKLSSYDILFHYLKPFHGNKELKKGTLISNPFLPMKQKTPSFNVYDASNEWRFKDFATGDEGSCFDLVMRLNRVTYIESLRIICNDFQLGNDSTRTIIKPPIKEIVQFDYTIQKKEFTKEELAYWNKFGINQEVLKQFNVTSLLQFSAKNKEGKFYTVTSNSGKYLFAYENENWVKIYKPRDEKKFRFQYLGQKDPDFIFGWEQLPKSGEIVFLTGGEKDVMALFSHGYPSFTLNSETAALSPGIVLELKSRFKNVLVLYDNDQTGTKQSDQLVKLHDIKKVQLKNIPNSGKDISDFFANGGSTQELKKLIESSLITTKKDDTEVEKVIFNARELLELANIEPKYLMSPILPQKGSAVLAGKPDTGKSQFARQLCIQIALGLNDFLGFELTPVHNNAIYVATEDNIEATQYLLKRQSNGLNVSPQDNLRFIFADTMEQEDILNHLDQALTDCPADFVVVDSFGDIFKGGDSNNNMAMRNTVKTFDKLAKKHDCLIMFVHHINKGAYRQAPGQEHIQGGAGLVQKVRLAIQLTEGEGNTRYFTVVKGNYCPKEYKQNSLQLEFSEETFLFSNTGKLIPTAELGTQPTFEKQDEKFNELERLADELFADKILSYSSFVKRYSEITGKSVATAKRAHTNLKNLELIVECNGSYRLNNPKSSEKVAEEEEEFEDCPF